MLLSFLVGCCSAQHVGGYNYPGYAQHPAKVVSSLHTLAIPRASVYHASPAIYAPAHHIIKPVIAKHVIADTYDPNPHYSFSYGVSDHHTGDSKHAEETLQNGVVHGSYSLTEPDGSIRKVTYTADDHNGFNAVVEKLGHAKVVAPVIAKVAYAPAAYHHPIAYHH